ncbi:hypothetical protein ACFVAE_11200 [Microbacterium sp. NPDC057659]|uniref:hypothetical protein n=1 Tax=Microbacterium sp. NPDC057659 TaxID=3346198 RepID=UPI003672C12E
MSADEYSPRRVALHPAARIGLLGVAIGTAWLAISLFTGGMGASAATGDDEGRQSVAQTVSAPETRVPAPVEKILAPVQKVLSPVVHEVAAPVKKVVAPVAREIAAPVKKVVAPVAKSVAPVAREIAAPVKAAARPAVAVVEQPPHAVTAPAPGVVKSDSSPLVSTLRATTGAVKSVPGAAVTVVESAPAILAAVPAALDALEVADVTGSVTGLLDHVVGGVPIAGDVVTGLLGTEPTGDLITPVARGVDGLVHGVVHSDPVAVPTAPDSVLPATADLAAPAAAPAPAPAVDRTGAASAPIVQTTLARSADDFFSAQTSGSTGPADSPLGGSVPPAAPAAPSPAGSAGSTAGGGGSAGASMISDAASAAVLHEATASLALSTVCDELPSSPVFDTDSTPD